MGKSGTVDHNPSPEERQEFKNEMEILDCYRKAFREDVRTVIREEWNEHFNNHQDITIINFWLGKITIKGKPIYLTTIALLAIIIYLIS